MVDEDVRDESKDDIKVSAPWVWSLCARCGVKFSRCATVEGADPKRCFDCQPFRE